jgi:PAS domain-containing protein
VIATGERTVKIAGDKGMQGIKVYSSSEAIIEAFQRARELLAIHQKDLEMAELLQAIFSNTETGILAIDRLDKITHFNLIAESLIGFKQKEIIGCSLNDISGIFNEFKIF